MGPNNRTGVPYTTSEDHKSRLDDWHIRMTDISIYQRNVALDDEQLEAYYIDTDNSASRRSSLKLAHTKPAI